MPIAPRGSSEAWLLGAVGLAVALVVWLSLPSRVIVFNDDFGYLRSIVETLQRGRPWTDDWLEPWSATLSIFAAITYKITGSFLLATYGLQSVLAGLGAVGATAILRYRGLSRGTAIGWSLAGLSLPTLLWKYAEFGALPLYLAAFFWMIYAFDNRRWGLFSVVWFLALGSRQSALVWLALPLGGLLELMVQKKIEWWRGVAWWGAIGLAGVAAYLFWQGLMNVTYAQRVMIPNILGNFLGPSFGKNIAIAAGVFVLSAGLGQFVLRCASGHPLRWSLSRTSLFNVCLATIIIGVLYAYDVRSLIAFEHSAWRKGGGVITYYLLFLLGLLGWWSGDLKLRIPYVIAAVGAALLLGLRAVIWEYYLLDVALLGVFATQPVRLAGSGVSCLGLGKFTRVAMATLLGLNANVAEVIKRRLDERHGAVVLVEQGLRDGLIEPTELAGTLCGYQGWKWYDYFITHEGASGRYIALFDKYIAPPSCRVLCDLPDAAWPSLENGRLNQGEMVLKSFMAPWHWTQQRHFLLIRTGPVLPAVWSYDRSTLRLPLFPLNDSEWRELISARTP